MNIVAYCRVSTDTDDQLNSLVTQKMFFEEYARKNHHNLIKIYADEGISGTKLKNRTAFRQLMRDAENKAFEMVAVKDISRFARNSLDFLQGIRYLKSKGIMCNFVNTNLTSTDSEMILVTLAAVAQEESANTSKRIKFSKRLNAEKGRVPNLVYGYDKIPGDYFNLKINSGEADVIRRIYRMYISDGCGAGKIAKTLNDEGYKTKRGCQWTQNAVSRILTNPLYTGRIINGKEEIEDFLTGVRTQKKEDDWMITHRPELAVIDNETFHFAQKILQKNRKTFHATGKRNNSKYLFSTLLRCTHCGYSFRRFERKYKNTYITWACSGRNSQGADSCCNTTVLYEDELLQSIWKYLSNFVTDKQSLMKRIAADFHKNFKINSENTKTEKVLLAELANYKKKRQKYMDMYENDIISMADLKEKTKEINNTIATCEDKLKMLEFNTKHGRQLENSLNKTFHSVDDILNTAEITNEMLKKVIDRIDVSSDGRVDIYFKLFKEIGPSETFLFDANRT